MCAPCKARAKARAARLAQQTTTKAKTKTSPKPKRSTSVATTKARATIKSTIKNQEEWKVVTWSRTMLESTIIVNERKRKNYLKQKKANQVYQARLRAKKTNKGK